MTLLFQCLTFTMGAVAMSGDRFLGVGNLAILVMHVSAVAFCVAAQIILLHWAADDAGSGQPLVLTYLLVFIVSQAVPCVTIYRQCGPYARMAEKASLRQVLRMLSVAAVVLFLYCAALTVNILTAAASLDIGGWTVTPSLFSALGIVILSLALTLPSWAPAAERLLRWGHNYQACRALYPLRRDLYEASPDIVLQPPGTAAVNDLGYRLHRRVVEIQDGWRDLRPHIEWGGVNGLTGSGDSQQTLAKAAQLRQALVTKRAGTAPEESMDDGDFTDRDTDNFAAEVARLTKVASAYSKLGREVPPGLHPPSDRAGFSLCHRESPRGSPVGRSSVSATVSNGGRSSVRTWANSCAWQAGRNAAVGGVKIADVVQQGHAVGVRGGGAEVVAAEGGAPAGGRYGGELWLWRTQRLPVRVEITGPRKSAGHPYDRDVIAPRSPGFVHVLLSPVPVCQVTDLARHQSTVALSCSWSGVARTANAVSYLPASTTKGRPNW